MGALNRRAFLLGTSALAATACLPINDIDPEMTMNGRFVLYYYTRVDWKEYKNLPIFKFQLSHDPVLTFNFVYDNGEANGSP